MTGIHCLQAMHKSGADLRPAAALAAGDVHVACLRSTEAPPRVSVLGEASTRAAALATAGAVGCISITGAAPAPQPGFTPSREPLPGGVHGVLLRPDADSPVAALAAEAPHSDDDDDDDDDGGGDSSLGRWMCQLCCDERTFGSEWLRTGNAAHEATYAELTSSLEAFLKAVHSPASAPGSAAADLSDGPGEQRVSSGSSAAPPPALAAAEDAAVSSSTTEVSASAHKPGADAQEAETPSLGGGRGVGGGGGGREGVQSQAFAALQVLVGNEQMLRHLEVCPAHGLGSGGCTLRPRFQTKQPPPSRAHHVQWPPPSRAHHVQWPPPSHAHHVQWPPPSRITIACSPLRAHHCVLTMCGACRSWARQCSHWQ